MVNLVIGRPVKSLNNTFTISDYYEGLDYLEKNAVKSVSFNLKAGDLTDEKAVKLQSFLNEVKIPTLIFSDDKSLHDIFEGDFISIIPTDSSPAFIHNRYVLVLDHRSLVDQISDISKQQRTIPFYALGILLLLEPLIKIAWFKFDTGFSFSTIFEIVSTIDNPFKVFEFWMLFPVAGVALLWPTAYSLFVFSGVFLYSTYAYFGYEKFTWPYVQENPHLSASLFLLFNATLLVYFLIPQNRKPFADKTRYYFLKPKRTPLHFNTLFTVGKKEMQAEVLNISPTGVLLSLPEEISSSGHKQLKIWDIDLQCTFIREVEGNNPNRFNYGLKFRFRNKEERQTLATFIQKHEQESAPKLARSA